MPISANSIALIRDASINQIIAHFVKLNTHGKGLCPFHDERTPSFTVSEKKGIYKCFGCGRYGDGIHFIMEHEHLNFVEAIEKIATLVGINLEYEEVADLEKYKEQQAEKETLKNTLKLAIEKYKKNLWDLPDDHPVSVYLSDRQITKEEIIEWQLGWAGADWKFLTSPFIEQGLFYPAQKVGLISHTPTSDYNYDRFRSRITIPITNHHGETIGLAGRWFPIDPKDAGNDFGKYINSQESEIYFKSAILFDLSRAAKAISEQGFAYLVEGYFDSIAMHKNGDLNTVASCGTSVTTQQVLLLKKYTNHVIVLLDGDTAGVNAAKKAITLLLKNGFKVDLGVLPEGKDPDDFVQSLPAEQKGQGVASLLNIKDGFLWMVACMVEGSLEDEFKLGANKGLVLELLVKIPNAFIRSNYIDSLFKIYHWTKGDLQKQLKVLLDQESESEVSPEDTNTEKLPQWVDREEFLRKGYCTVNNKSIIGYYTFHGSVKVEITNFIIKPLFHIFAQKDSRHLIEINNGVEKAVLDIESKTLISPDLLEANTVAYGDFIIFGSKLQFKRIASNLLRNFPKCYEVTFLGWQRNGFFAFVDKVFIPGTGLKDLDESGIIKITNSTIDLNGETIKNEKNYLVAAACSAYKEMQDSGEDSFENHRVLTYVKSTVTFSQWAEKMNRVYPEKGLVGIAYTVLTIFRDIIFDIDHNVPHLYGFGEQSSGKSKWAESINSFFYKGRAAFPLSLGTDFAFFYYMRLFPNCPAWLNEFNEKTLRPEWFQSLKGVFDGEGRQRGVMGSKNKIEEMKVHSTLILTGQYLHTGDDNSIVTRSIIEGFNKRKLTEDDQREYDQLKELEKNGISSLVCEVLAFREEFKSLYKPKFSQVLSRWKMEWDVSSENNQRVMQNWCHIYCCFDFISKYFKLPVLSETVEKYCLAKVSHWSNHVRSSDVLSEFFNAIVFLSDQQLITEGWHFKIKMEKSVKVRNGKEEFIKEFTEPTKVIYIRMNIVHPLYQQHYRTRTGREGMSLENLDHYFSSRPYFVGPHKSTSFKRWVNKMEQVNRNGLASMPNGEFVKSLVHQKSSCHMFLYDQLSISLEQSTGINGVGGQDEFHEASGNDLPFPIQNEN